MTFKYSYLALQDELYSNCYRTGFNISLPAAVTEVFDPVTSITYVTFKIRTRSSLFGLLDWEVAYEVYTNVTRNWWGRKKYTPHVTLKQFMSDRGFHKILADYGTVISRCRAHMHDRDDQSMTIQLQATAHKRDRDGLISIFIDRKPLDQQVEHTLNRCISHFLEDADHGPSTQDEIGRAVMRTINRFEKSDVLHDFQTVGSLFLREGVFHKIVAIAFRKGYLHRV